MVENGSANEKEDAPQVARRELDVDVKALARKISVEHLVVGLCGLVLFVMAFLPWAKIQLGELSRAFESLGKHIEVSTWASGLSVTKGVFTLIAALGLWGLVGARMAGVFGRQLVALGYTGLGGLAALCSLLGFFPGAGLTWGFGVVFSFLAALLVLAIGAARLGGVSLPVLDRPLSDLSAGGGGTPQAEGPREETKKEDEK